MLAKISSNHLVAFSETPCACYFREILEETANRDHLETTADWDLR